MVETTPTAVRLPTALIRKIDAYGRKLTKDTGLRVSRNEVIRLLLERGLAASADKPAE